MSETVNEDTKRSKWVDKPKMIHLNVFTTQQTAEHPFRLQIYWYKEHQDTVESGSSFTNLRENLRKLLKYATTNRSCLQYKKFVDSFQ